MTLIKNGDANVKWNKIFKIIIKKGNKKRIVLVKVTRQESTPTGFTYRSIGVQVTLRSPNAPFIFEISTRLLTYNWLYIKVNTVFNCQNSGSFYSWAGAALAHKCLCWMCLSVNTQQVWITQYGEWRMDMMDICFTQRYEIPFTLFGTDYARKLTM